jgi:acyl carrier protein
LGLYKSIMEHEILDQLQKIFQLFFKDNNLRISINTTAKDIVLWDSFHHIQLIAVVEDQFKIKFSVFELADLNNVGDLVNCIQHKLA